MKLATSGSELTLGGDDVMSPVYLSVPVEDPIYWPVNSIASKIGGNAIFNNLSCIIVSVRNVTHDLIDIFLQGRTDLIVGGVTSATFCQNIPSAQ